MKRLLLPLLVVLFSAVAHAQDFEAPMVTSISVTSSVDVSSGDATVTATMDVTDNDTGFDFGNIFLYRADGGFVSSHFFNSDELTIGDSLDGTYEITATVPQYASAGSWEVRCFVADFDGNERDYGSGAGDEAYPVPADAFFTVVNSGTVDSVVPAIASVSVSPSPIDTGTIGQNVVITVNITDALSGFRSASLIFRDPTSNSSNGISAFAFDTQAVSGDDNNGTYNINATIPQGSLDGIWTIDFFVRDKVGNGGFITAPTGATFQVSNSAGGDFGDLSDATDATQYSWTTSGGEDWFPQTVVTNDGVDAAQSGAIGDNDTSDMEVSVTGPGTLYFSWKVDSEEFGDYLSVEVLGGGDYDDISGDSGWLSSSVTIPSGAQTVRFRYEKDGGGSSGDDAGWVDQVCFEGDSDTEDPRVQRISISPNPIDISLGYVEATVTIEVSDDFNGFSDGYLYIFEDSSSNEYNSYYFDSVDLVSGDSKFGTYEITAEFYQEDFGPDNEEGGGYEEGTYRLAVEVSEQVTGNTRTYGDVYGFIGDSFPIPSSEFFTIGGAPTGSGPMLTGITSITPDPVDVTTGDQSITVVFGVIDNNIGFGYGDVSVFNSSGSFVQSVSFDSDERISGDDSNGTYSVTIPIYQYSAPGTWSLNFFLSDFDDNSNDYPFEVGFPNPGEEEFTVENTGSVDTMVPTLTAFSLSPTTVDTSGSAQSVAYSISLTDDLSGLTRVAIQVYDPNNIFVSSLFESFPVSGELSGTYTGTLDLPMGSMEGDWKVALSVRDRAGNSFFYAPSSLGFGTLYPSPFSGEFSVGPVTGGTTFGNFASNFGLSGMDALPGANSDKDSYNNALELILGLNPTVANAPNASLYEAVRVGNEMRINFTVDPSLSVSVNGDYLEISDGGATPVMVTGQTGVNLVDDWANQLPTNTSGTTYRVTLPISSPGSGNVRLHFMAP